ncbi:MAG: rRNA maturation RNase YbeY [Defluviitaleaceae bacterium]|nr:rRNA maturation RNase YbeY [Defluviitaleaceae bacterium]
MKIYWDDRGISPVAKPLYVTLKRAVLATLRQGFDLQDAGKLAYELNISFVSDAEIKELNKNYREMDKPTDVLSFPTVGAVPESGAFPMGDIVISTETAARQASEFGHSFERELTFLTVHGVLHLLGLDHEADPNDEAIMKEIQENILAEVLT